MNGSFVWNELATGDVEAAKGFFEGVLGWTFEEFPLPEGPYWVARAGDTLVGGVSHFDVSSLPEKTPAWLPFIEVDRIDDRVEAARNSGAEIIQAPHDVPNVGRVAILRDPTGAPIGFLTGA